MGVLVTIALIALIAQLWTRLNKLQERITQLEWAEYHARSASDGPWNVGETPVEAAEEDPARPPAKIVGEPIPAPPLIEEALVPPPATQAEPIATESFQEIPEPDHRAESEGAVGRKFGFEDMFGRKLPIWAGGITLAVAGMLIVKYSIDAGLVSPLVRVIAGLIFGSVLIGAAEAALRADDRVRDPRVRQALAGAGVASLYGAILIAANVYGLVSPVAAFLGMAAVTALAMGLSLRFGAPSALLGLAGGLAAPALVGSVEPNIPLLSAYLALAVGGLSVLSKSQRWMWLGLLALTGGFGWAGLLLIGGTLDTVSSISLGLYIVLLGIVLPMVAFSGRLGNAVRVAGSIAAAAQMAGLVATGGFTLLHWGLFGLISAAIIWMANRDQQLSRLPAVGLAIALLLLAAWPDPTAGQLATVMTLGAALYGLPALRALWRKQGTMVEAAEIAALGLAALVVPMIHFYRIDRSNDVALALISLGAALLPAGAAALGWFNAVRRDDARFALLATTAAALVAASAALALPDSTLAPLFGLLGFGLLALSLRAEDLRLETSAWAFAAAALALLALGFQSDAEFDRLFGLREGVELVTAVVRWTGLAAIFALFAWKGRSTVGRDIAQALAALLAYGAIAQIPLADALPLAPVLGLAALALWSRRLAPDALLPALTSLLTASLLWAAAPLWNWTFQALSSLFGIPMLVTNLPGLRDVVLRLLIPALLIALAWRLTASHLLGVARLIAVVVASVTGAVALHVLFKQLWSIGTVEEFVRFGLAERITLEGLLLGAALLAWRFNQPRIAICITAAGLAHFVWYTLLVHNPLLSAQAVGPLPVINLLLPAYGLPLIWLWLIGRCHPGLPAMVERIRSAAPMLLIILFAFSSLRQLFHGSILTDPGVTAGEDIFRSILAILLAIGFLLWGISRGSRDWRIASLVMMIAAVAKVFLLDASGLDGLLRIGSFVALGLSLIGIGWLYSRYLGGDVPSAQQMATANL
jgi:uncharacterized membrane protein